MTKKINANFVLGDSAVFIGSTGTGKTSGAKELLKQFDIQSNGTIPVYIIDSKLSGDFKEFTKKGVGVHYFGDDIPPLFNKKGEGNFIVWTPDSDDKVMYDEFFEGIYMNGRHNNVPALILVDELSSIAPTGFPPVYYNTIIKQGRGMKISVISLTQVSRYVPVSMSSQLTHLFMFRLNSSKDIKKLTDDFGAFAKKHIPDQHGFYYRDLKKDVSVNPAKYFPSYTEFFK
jgi:hypothetical protein